MNADIKGGIHKIMFLMALLVMAKKMKTKFYNRKKETILKLLHSIQYCESEPTTASCICMAGKINEECIWCAPVSMKYKH